MDDERNSRLLEHLTCKFSAIKRLAKNRPELWINTTLSAPRLISEAGNAVLFRVHATNRLDRNWIIEMHCPHFAETSTLPRTLTKL
jgi:hypothetical protein